MAADPYAVLGVTSTVSDPELRAAYRSMVKRHHPDHNGGSIESKLRFEQVQSAYAAVLQLRAGQKLRAEPAAAPRAAAGPARPGPPKYGPSALDLDARIAAMERDIAQSRTREQARRRAEEERRQVRATAARATAQERLGTPSREELGYVDSDDSFSAILADALDQVAERLRTKPEER